MVTHFRNFPADLPAHKMHAQGLIAAGLGMPKCYKQCKCLSVGSWLNNGTSIYGDSMLCKIE